MFRYSKGFILPVLAATMMTAPMSAENVSVSTPKTSLALDITKGETLKFLYYGDRLNAADVAQLQSAGTFGKDAYPVYGLSAEAQAALSVQHADGNLTLDMSVEGFEQVAEANAKVLKVQLKDRVYPFYVTVCYRAYNDVDILEMWTEIKNGEKQTVTLKQFDSAYMPIRRGDVWMSHFYGAWANEAQLSEEPLKPGTFVIENRDGVRNAQTSRGEVMFSLDGKAQENSGRVIGAAICYTGNYKLRAVTDESEYHQFFAGIDDYNSEYHLKKNETFVTPVTAFSYSKEGLSGVSRNFHRWGRKYKLANADRERKILLNSWEGVYLNINEKDMAQMMADIKSMGGELFVMDDGWFGEKYPRKTDNSALGDWKVDREKLPNGIEGLLDEAKKLGVKFGIWIEPEMSNTKSELYDKHPDWVIKAPKRELRTGRGGTQVVLDLANPKVQDFVFSVVDDLMTKYPEIDYIKWDANMHISNHGSQYLTADNQSHLYIDYHRGLEKALQRIRAKYPDLTIQDCASGGGRVNWGYLPYFDEFWTSDNTDALQRVYMQWGTSYFFPAIAMAAHISNAPNHQTARTVPLKFRTDVAMCGRLGMEIQPKVLSDVDKDQCRKAIADYKRIRPIVQFGDLYRLQSPFEKKGVASLMYVTETKDKAVFYWFKTEAFCNQHLPRIPMAGLDPQKRYRVTELNRIDHSPLSFEGKTFSGEYLMQNGLEIPYGHNADWGKANEWASRVLLLEAL